MVVFSLNRPAILTFFESPLRRRRNSDCRPVQPLQFRRHDRRAFSASLSCVPPRNDSSPAGRPSAPQFSNSDTRRRCPPPAAPCTVADTNARRVCVADERARVGAPKPTSSRRPGWLRSRSPGESDCSSDTRMHLPFVLVHHWPKVSRSAPV